MQEVVMIADANWIGLPRLANNAVELDMVASNSRQTFDEAEMDNLELMAEARFRATPLAAARDDIEEISA